MCGAVLLVQHCPDMACYGDAFNFYTVCFFVFILNNAAVTGYLRGYRYPARINYPAQRQNRNRLFEVGSFVVCSFETRTDIVCHREPQYILVARYTLVNIIYFPVGEYFSYT